jgi:hypothetical protein
MRLSNWIAPPGIMVPLGAGLIIGALSVVDACTPAQLGAVEDASNKRDTICAFVEAWAPSTPELAEIQELCAAGADLKEIAAAYAGCRPEDESESDQSD